MKDNFLNFYNLTQRKGLINRTNQIADLLVKNEVKKLLFRPNSKPMTLELGATQGQHLKFVQLSDHKIYVGIDIEIRQSEDLSPIINLTSVHNNLVFLGGDIERLPFKSKSFDLVTSLCVFHHLLFPEKAMAEVIRVLKPGGYLVVQLPTDPGFLNQLIKRLVIFPILRKSNNSDIKLYYARSHRNHIWALLRQFEHILKPKGRVKVRYWPFVFPSWNFNLSVIVVFKKF